jgi:hypothetical protein
VVLLVLAAVGGSAAGLVRRPAGGHGARPHLQRWPLFAAALALLLLASLTHGDVCTVIYAGGLALLAAFAGANWTLTGMGVIGLGVLLNLGAVVLDNGVPVRPRALVQAHAASALHVGDHHLRAPRHLETNDDAYPWMGDIVPVPFVHEAVSFGDLLILVGLADVAREISRRRARPPEVDDVDGDATEPVGGGTIATTTTTPVATAAQPAATTHARVDHDWGTAPNGSAESGSQCSAKPETTEDDIIDFWKDAALPPEPAHLAARQQR